MPRARNQPEPGGRRRAPAAVEEAPRARWRVVDEPEGVAAHGGRLSAWQRFTHFELPAGVIPLVWNGMMSFGGGWFFLAASEAITVLNEELFLPGVGSYLALAVRQQDPRALGAALVTMAALIVLVDRAFWRPLVAWAEKFKVEQSPGETPPRSAVLALLRRSRVVPWVEARLARADEAIDRGWRRGARESAAPADPSRERLKDRVLAGVLWSVLVGLGLRGMLFVATEVDGLEVPEVERLGLPAGLAQEGGAAAPETEDVDFAKLARRAPPAPDDEVVRQFAPGHESLGVGPTKSAARRRRKLRRR